MHIIKHRENGWCFGVATDKYGYFPATSVSCAHAMLCSLRKWFLGKKRY